MPKQNDKAVADDRLLRRIAACLVGKLADESPKSETKIASLLIDAGYLRLTKESLPTYTNR